MNKEYKNALTKFGVPKNIRKPSVKIKHSDLERFSDDSIFKSICPVCKIGILPLSRDLKEFKLMNTDRCMLCGQYLNIQI